MHKSESYDDCECGNPRFSKREGCDACRELERLVCKMTGTGTDHVGARQRTQGNTNTYDQSVFDYPHVVPPTLSFRKYLRFRFDS